MQNSEDMIDGSGDGTLHIEEWPFLLVRFKKTVAEVPHRQAELAAAAMSRSFLDWTGEDAGKQPALFFAHHPTLSEWWAELREDFLKGSEHITRNHSFRHTDGRLYRVQAAAENDSLSLMFMQKADEAETREPAPEMRTRQVAEFEEEKVLMCRYRLDGSITYMNEAFATFFDKPADKPLADSNVFSLLSEEETKEVKRFIDKVVSSGERCCYLSEFTVNGQQRRVLWFEKLQPGSPPEIESAGYELSAFLYQKQAFELKMEQQQAILEAIPYYIFAKDSEKRYLFANSKFAAAFGKTPADIIGLTDNELTDDPEWVGKYEESDNKVLSSGNRVVMPGQYDRRSDGQYGWFQTIKVPYHHPGEGKSGILGIALDISDRKIAMDELARQKEQFEVAIRGINDGIWDWDLRKDTIFYSPKWKEQLGYRDDEIPNETHSFEMLLHPEDKGRTYEYIRAYHQGKAERYDVEFRMRHKAGHYLWIHSRGDALRDENGIPYRMAGSHTDITQRKKNEAALLESQQRYASIISAIPDLIFSIRRDGTYLGYHAPADAMLYTKPESFLGKKIPDVLPPELADRFMEAIGKVLKGESLQLFEYELEIAGDTKYFESRIVKSDKDEVLSIVRDMSEEIRAKTKLLEAQKVLLQTSKMAQVGGWEYYPRENKVFWSELTFQIFEKNPETFKPALPEILSLYEQKDAKILEAAIARLVKTGEPYDIQHQIKRADGGLKWVRSIGNGDFSEGYCTRVYGSVQDIDEQKRNLLELELARQKLQSIFAEMSEVVWSLRLPDYSVSFATPSFEQVFGVSIKTWVENQAVCQELVHPEDYPELLKQYKKIISHGSYDTEYRIIRNGEVRWVHEKAKKIYNAEGTAVRIDGFTSDVTREKNAEIERAHYSEMLSLLFRIASTFINPKLDQFDTDIEAALGLLGAFVESDRVYIFDYHFDRMVTDNTYEWCAPGVEPVIEMMQDVPIDLFRPCYECHLRREVFYAPDTSLIEDEALRQLMADQMIKSIITLPMYEADVLIGFVGFDSVKSLRLFTEKETNLLKIFADVLTNVQQRIRLERELKQARLTAEDASKAKSLFVANMSHEIRTPLNGVIGFTELLQDTPLDTEQQQYLDNIQVSAESLLSIISDILDFSKIEAGKMELEYLPVDLYAIAAEATDIIKYQAANSGLNLLINMPYGSFPKLIADPVRLKQILVNLLSNAVKFSEEGEVELIVQPKATSEGRMTVYFEVRDTGIGISDEIRDKLFTSFTQADNSMTRRFGGTGLGLVICAMLLQKMNSRIDFESEPGKGSRFFFEITFETSGEDTPVISTGLEGIVVHILMGNERESWLMLDRLHEFGMHPQIHGSRSSLENAVTGLNTENPEHQQPLIITELAFFEDGIAPGDPLSVHINSIIMLHSIVETRHAESLISRKKISHRLIKPVNIKSLQKLLVKIYAESTSLNHGSNNKKPVAPALTKNIKRVMIVEDVKINMVLAKTLVNKILSHPVIIEAENGRLAVRKFEELKGSIDLILMDIQMPEMDGIEATVLIRKAEKHTSSRTPIIALTAGVVKEERQRCFDAGIDAFISKPVDAEILKSYVNQFIDGCVS